MPCIAIVTFDLCGEIFAYNVLLRANDFRKSLPIIGKKQAAF